MTLPLGAVYCTQTSKVCSSPMPALPTLTDICIALGTGVDSILSAYITQDTPIRWTPLAEKLEELDLEKQHKIKTILDYLIETI